MSHRNLNALKRFLDAACVCVAAAGLTLVAACGNDAHAKTGDEGPNGGFIVALRGGEAYLEVLVSDSDTAAAERAMTVHVLDAKLAPKRLLDPPQFVEGSSTMTAVALAEASSTEGSPTWVFVGEQFDELPHGDFEIRLGGETVEAHLHPPGADGHDHDHDHGDHDHDHGDHDHSDHDNKDH